MPDYIGNVEVPEISVSNAVFPLVMDWGSTRAQEPIVAIHQFGSANEKIEQRFYIGPGLRRWRVALNAMTISRRDALLNFWEGRRGPYEPFKFDAPSDDGSSVTRIDVRFENEPLSFEQFGAAMCSTGVTLVEVPDPAAAPSYSITSELERFPDASLEAALLDQAQTVIPLLKITATQSGYPVIYLSDRRSTVGGQLYQARLLSVEGISQSMNGEADDARFVFGNADRVMLTLANDTDLWMAKVEFRVFHVGTGVKLDLWTGYISQWSHNAAEFRIEARDALQPLTRLWPTRRIDRRCWKKYNDSVNCPFASQGSLDLVHYPSASAGSCDRGYDTANGCLAHGMKRYFGGLLSNPQGVWIRNNAKGAKNFFTATSIVNDSVYGRPLKKIYTDRRIPVQCDIIAGREESDFYAALAIVGEGPLSHFFTPQMVDGKAVGHTLDGQLHHGFQKGVPRPPSGASPASGELGLRTALGTDPAGATDFLSLGESGDQTKGDWRRVYSGNSTYDDNFAAGAALIELRRADEPGIQLGRPEQHEVVAQIDGGLGGWFWQNSSTRAWHPNLVNPFWICVNTWLEVQGLQNASAAAQAATFDVESAIACAAICDDVVPKLVGTGSETQFTFRGVAQEQRPLADWLTEILKNCLGYWFFRNGKLAFGIRVNSSAVEAFSVGNIILNSLELANIEPRFNDLAAQFNNEELDGQPDTIPLYDEDHGERVGRRLPSTIDLAGTTTRSQAARIVITRLREELGGVGAAQQRAARRGSFLTTILALAVEPGMVCSLTHPDMPGGSGEFRVKRWELNPDWSIRIEWQTTTDDMYNVAVGPKPADVEVDFVPVEFQPQPARQRWHPNAAAPDPGDPLYASTEKTFGIRQDYVQLADGSVRCALVIDGSAPVNKFKAGAAPSIIRSSEVNTALGGLPGGRVYYLMVACYDGSRRFSPPSNLHKVNVSAGTETNQITITVEWPAGTWAGYFLYASDFPQTITSQADVAGTPPAQVTLAGPLHVSNFNAPNQSHSHARIKVTRMRYPGTDWGPITAVAAGKITAGSLAGLGKNFAGRRLTVMSDLSDGAVPLWNYEVTAFDDETGEFTVTPDPLAAAGDKPDAGDMLVVRAKATASSSTSISDSLLEMVDDEEKGNLVRILYGKGRGQVRRIGSNTLTSCTVDEPWETTPDSTSIWVITLPTWEFIAETSPTQNADVDMGQQLVIPIENFDGDFVLAMGTLVDEWGLESLEAISPVREIYIHGALGAGSIEKYHLSAGLEGDAAVGLPDKWRYTATVPEGKRVAWDQWVIEALQAPAGADLVVDILVWDPESEDPEESIFGPNIEDKLVIAAGQTRGEQLVFAPVYLLNKWCLRAAILQIGSETAGGGVYIHGYGHLEDIP